MQTPSFPAKRTVSIVVSALSGSIGGTGGIGRCTTGIPGTTWD